MDEAYAPPSVLPDALKNSEDLFLFMTLGEAFGSDSKRTESDTSNTTKKVLDRIAMPDELKNAYRSFVCATMPQMSVECCLCIFRMSSISAAM